MAALLAGACAVWFALFEVYYDGSPMPAFLASGERIVFFLPMLTVYLVRELLRRRLRVRQGRNPQAAQNMI